jgi:deazaflavin-dependent oxidoreductase (nitroreductase family)
MGIFAWIVAVLAVMAVPMLLVRFRTRWVAKFNLAVTNRVTGFFVEWMPGFGMLTHVGRKSGKIYRTPVNVFRRPGGFLIALTYGPDSEWVKNVVVAGGCRLVTRSVRYELSTPSVVHDPTRGRFPIIVRAVLRMIGAEDFLQLSSAPH